MYYADWDYWKQIPRTDLYSAVQLSFGIDPRDEGDIRSDKINPCENSKTMPEEQLKERHEIAKKNLYHGLDVESTGSLSDSGFFEISLAKFATWALRKGWDIPQQLAEMAKHAQPEINLSYSTEWLAIQNAAIREFFNPRRNPDAKRDQIIDWIKQQARAAGLGETDNIPKAIFTIIKPANHDPKKKRVEPSE